MFKKSKHIKNLICIFVSIALANILSVTAHADVFDTLRPETSKSSIKDELEKKATTKETTPPPEPRVRFEGHGTAREAVVAGSAAALYHYSIDEVVKSLRPQDIPSELARMETFLSNLPAEMEKAVEITPDVK